MVRTASVCVACSLDSGGNIVEFRLVAGAVNDSPTLVEESVTNSSASPWRCIASNLRHDGHQRDLWVGSTGGQNQTVSARVDQNAHCQSRNANQLTALPAAALRLTWVVRVSLPESFPGRKSRTEALRRSLDSIERIVPYARNRHGWRRTEWMHGRPCSPIRAVRDSGELRAGNALAKFPGRARSCSATFAGRPAARH